MDILLRKRENPCALTRGTAVWRCIGAAGFQWSLCRRPERWCIMLNTPAIYVPFSFHFHPLPFILKRVCWKTQGWYSNIAAIAIALKLRTWWSTARFWSTQFQKNPKHHLLRRWAAAEWRNANLKWLGTWQFQIAVEGGSPRSHEECNLQHCSTRLCRGPSEFAQRSRRSRMGGDQRLAVLCKVSWFLRFLHWIIFALQDSEVTWLLRLALRKQDGLSGWLMHWSTDWVGRREENAILAFFQPLRNHGS